MIVSINPATEEKLTEFEPWSNGQVDTTIERVAYAQRIWRAMNMEQRAVPMRRVAQLLRERAGRYGALITSEMGKPIVEAEAEVAKCALACDHYADHAAEYLADAPVATESLESYVAYEPLGVVLAIMPWNFPFWQVFRAGAPTLMAGNGIVLKHASNVPQSALACEEVLRDAGFPQDLLRTVLIEGGGTERLIDDVRIAAVTLTGSSEVGARIASLAAARLKKQVLELGGSDPFIVLADADLAYAARTAARARNQNNGQSCIAAKRFIVEETVADEFGALFSAAVSALSVGDPTSRDTNVGPLARADLRDTLERQVATSRDMGAEAIVGGERVNGRGFFYAPTILDGVTDAMPAFREETFGPVAALVRARDVEHAIELANDTEYGLGAAVWTRDLEAAKGVARRIEAGSVFVNGLVASDPRMPMGGVKRSGYGRELGRHGIWEFTNIQTVRIGPAEAPIV
ncbi:MAG: NAD-dependent succinate-semialdehyde dehydrogenase [Chloroflexota bacterium]|nr:NAD-dependent succinate-semialdehyde dehydrogenase [Chloroflexota bacterium]